MGTIIIHDMAQVKGKSVPAKIHVTVNPAEDIMDVEVGN